MDGIRDDGGQQPPAETKHTGHCADRGTSPIDLITFLGRNKPYAWLFSGEVVNMTGAWLTYVATLTVAERYGQSSGMLISLIIILRLVPSTLWCAVAGAVADRCNRVHVLMLTCCLDAVVVAALSVVNSPGRLWCVLVHAITCAIFCPSVNLPNTIGHIRMPVTHHRSLPCWSPSHLNPGSCMSWYFCSFPSKRFTSPPARHAACPSQTPSPLTTHSPGHCSSHCPQG